MKSTFVSFLFLLVCFEVFAQSNDPVYLDKLLNPLPDTSGAEYIRNILSTHDDVFDVRDYRLEDSSLYQKGTIKITYVDSRNHKKSLKKRKKKDVVYANLYGNDWKHTSHGIFERYYPNGQLEFKGLYQDGKKTGMFKYWYENGNPKGDFVYSEDLEVDQPFQVITFYDSLNNLLVSKGNGQYHERSINDPNSRGFVTRGQVKDGFKAGEWTGSYQGIKASFVEYYAAGKLINGVSKDSLGNEYRYTVLDELPEYANGGMMGFYQFVGNNMMYLRDALSAGIQGKVYVQFVVDKEGRVTEVKTVKGLNASCNEEAERVIRLAGRFKPGKDRGQLVKVRMVMPIIFKLSN